MISRASEQVASLLFMLLGVGMVILSGELQPVIENDVGSGFLPKIVGIGFIVLSLLKLVLSFKLERQQKAKTAYNIKKGLLTIFIFGMYVMTIKYLGFVIATMLYLVAQLSVFKWENGIKKKEVIQIALLSILAPIIIKLIFVNLLDLVLPASRLF